MNLRVKTRLGQPELLGISVSIIDFDAVEFSFYDLFDARRSRQKRGFNSLNLIWPVSVLQTLLHLERNFALFTMRPNSAPNSVLIKSYGHLNFRIFDDFREFWRRSAKTWRGPPGAPRTFYHLSSESRGLLSMPNKNPDPLGDFSEL